MNPRSSNRYSRDAQIPSSSDVSHSSLAGSRTSNPVTRDYREHVLLPDQLNTQGTLQEHNMSYPYYGQESVESSETRHLAISEQYQTPQHVSMPPPMQQHANYGAAQQFTLQQPTMWEMVSQHFPLSAFGQPVMQDATKIDASRDNYSQTESQSYPDLAASPFQSATALPASSASAELVTLQRGDQTKQPQAEAALAYSAERQSWYEEQLRNAFEAINAGRVNEARNLITNLTRWLFSTIEERGLHHDNEAEYLQRLVMWREFNHCWEALGLKQKDITEQAIRTKETPTDIMTSRDITDLVNELVAQCDQIEQYGLVDYEMGVWEEQIVAIFIICLELLTQLNN